MTDTDQAIIDLLTEIRDRLPEPVTSSGTTERTPAKAFAATTPEPAPLLAGDIVWIRGKVEEVFDGAISVSGIDCDGDEILLDVPPAIVRREAP